MSGPSMSEADEPDDELLNLEGWERPVSDTKRVFSL